MLAAQLKSPKKSLLGHGGCDAHRGPQKLIASNLGDKTKQCLGAIEGRDGKSLAICDFELRFLSPKPLPSPVNPHLAN